MRVRFMGGMPAIGYSGGRLHALTMAEALAMSGAEVDFVTNSIPEMYDEFRPFSRVVMIALKEHDNLSAWVDRSIDIVVIVPSADGQLGMHSEWARHAIECHARIALLSFESLNWFNEVSPYKSDPALWNGWNLAAEYADLVISSTHEGNRWAQAYYTFGRKPCRFEVCPPGINTILADQIPGVPERAKQIILISRFAAHKGLNALEPLARPGLEGYRVIVVVGKGEFPADEYTYWQERFGERGMEFEVRLNISSAEKFALFKSSAALYYPTRFEGFGLPPLEAAYCHLPSACSDLPVLREVGRETFAYGRPDDPDDMHRAVMEALDSRARLIDDFARISEIARIDAYGQRAKRVLEQVL